jgi:hypothetical protein
MYAMLSAHMNIPYPERLPDNVLVEKMRQLDWLLCSNHLPVKLDSKSAGLLPYINTEADGEDKG